MKPFTDWKMPFVILAGSLLLASFNVSARYGQRQFIYAPVVDVQPVYRTVRTAQPQEVCWDEPVYRDLHSRQRQYGNPGGAILGAIIGGAIGNRFGRGHGRDAATFAGAVLGSAIGAQAGSTARHRYDDRHAFYGRQGLVEYRSRCRIERNFIEEERIVAYDVTYEFDGRLLHTRLNHHPGDRIRLHVNLEVAE